MGRFLTPSGGNLVTVSNITNINPHLQQGTPKQMQYGEPRACYAMLSYNTSSTWYGATFYDKFFQPVVKNTYDYGNNSSIPGNNFYITDSTLQYGAQVFNNVSPTQSAPGSNGTSSYLNATNAAGEFGNAMIDAFSNSTLVRTMSRNSSWNIKYYNNLYAVNSDHTDKSIVYVLANTTFRAISRIDGDYSYNRRGTTHYVIPNMPNSMYGSASYNNVRKELIVLSFVSSGGTFKLIRFKGIDFDKFPSPHLAFTQANVVREEVASFTLGTWPVNNNESYYNVKPVLVDDGNIFTSVMHTSNGFYLYKTVVATGTLSVTSSSVVATYNLTTSYGIEQDIYFGQRFISSRDGRAVLTFCPYYYYGAGIYSFVVDRTNSAFYQPTFMNSANTSIGFLPVPYGDDGFATFYCGNGYASSHTGNYITGMCNRNGTGVFEQSGTNIYFPYHTGPNTTNYPGFTQVTDYSMLDNQNVI